MDCEQYREMISELVDGELTEPQKTGLYGHIAVCPECRRIYDAFTALSSCMKDSEAEPPAGLVGSVMASIRNGAAQKPRKKPVRFAAITALAACLALVALAGARVGVFSSEKLMSRATDMNGAVVENTVYDSESDDAEVTRFSQEMTPIPLPTTEGGAGESEEYQEAAGEEAAAEDNSGSISLYAAPALPVRAVVYLGGYTAELDDEAALSALLDALSYTGSFDGELPSGDADYLVELFYSEADREFVYTTPIYVYVTQEGLVCLAGSAVYFAAGTQSELSALISAG